MGRPLIGRGTLWCVVCRAVSGGTQSSKGLRVPSRGVGGACGSGSPSGVSPLISKEFPTGTDRSLRSILSEFKRKKISGRASCKPQLLSGRDSGGSGMGTGLYLLSQCRGHTLGGQQPRGREGTIQ